MERTLKRTSKFLSLILRHQPEKIGITLDDAGWVDIDRLIAAARESGTEISRDLLFRVVRENDKRRFAVSEDQTKIRASQGHSVSIDLGLEPAQPPDLLFHGTVSRFIDAIKLQGLKPGSRQHVHLSKDVQTATTVGRRRGVPIILKVRSGAMHQEGYEFYLSANGVWLTDRVPTEFIEFDGD